MPPVRVVRSVFRGLLGHAVLVKSCTIETSAAAISRILASIGGEKIGRFVARLRNKCHVSQCWIASTINCSVYFNAIIRNSIFTNKWQVGIEEYSSKRILDSRSREMIVCLHLVLNIEIRRFRLGRKSASSI